MASTDRVYVAVYAYFNEDGLLLPREIVWEDGCRYPIDRVLFVETAAAQKAGKAPRIMHADKIMQKSVAFFA